MPSPEDRRPAGPPRPAHRVVNAATLPIASQRPSASVPHRDHEPPTRPNPVPRQGPPPQPAPPLTRRPPAPPEQQRRPVPGHYVQRPEHYVQRPEHYGVPPAQQIPFAADRYPFDPPRMTTTQRPHRRVDTSVLCAAAALVLLGVAVLVGILL
ncbi:hypothetical protein [Gordonia rubripertincta]|uniref:Uncharacterized protein n=1 Tax=Gordonia rubripertincta TaxID=36822 RepID=A0ABT4MYN6_GORRU|nr:hypothetical protein [Gordonia rubripertincta]MCZ4552093.1 hypothetical protein [Gordonia rubripertincta]